MTILAPERTETVNATCACGTVHALTLPAGESWDRTNCPCCLMCNASLDWSAS